MRFVFGPVPSRRLGRSLGIDPFPSKICNFNCVYCQLGRTRLPSSSRAAYFDAEDIAAEVRAAITNIGNSDVDWVTFVGSGETTLYSRLGSLINTVKTNSDFPVAVITNGSLLFRPDVREELVFADAVLPSLDAGTDTTFRRINRPHPVFTFDRHVNGLIEFGGPSQASCGSRSCSSKD